MKQKYYSNLEFFKGHTILTCLNISKKLSITFRKPTSFYMMEQWPELYERKDYRQEQSHYTFCHTLALKNIKFTPIFKLLNFNPNPIMTYNVCHIKFFIYLYNIYTHMYCRRLPPVTAQESQQRLLAKMWLLGPYPFIKSKLKLFFKTFSFPCILLPCYFKTTRKGRTRTYSLTPEPKMCLLLICRQP